MISAIVSNLRIALFLLSPFSVYNPCVITIHSPLKYLLGHSFRIQSEVKKVKVLVVQSCLTL